MKVKIDWERFDIEIHRNEHCNKKTVFNPVMEPKFNTELQIHANILLHKSKNTLESVQHVGNWHLIEDDAWYHDSIVIEEELKYD